MTFEFPDTLAIEIFRSAMVVVVLAVFAYFLLSRDLFRFSDASFIRVDDDDSAATLSAEAPKGHARPASLGTLFPVAIVVGAVALMAAAEATHAKQVAGACSKVTSAIEAGSVRTMGASDWERIGSVCGRDALLNSANSKSSVLSLGSR